MVGGPQLESYYSVLLQVIIIVSIWHCYSSQEMLLQSSSLAGQGTSPIIGHACVLPKVRHKRVSWLHTRQKDEGPFLQHHPRPLFLPIATTQMGATSGKVQNHQESDSCTEHKLISPSKWYLSIYLHRICF